jgi:membrane-associated phospholipid phosphatase
VGMPGGRLGRYILLLAVGFLAYWGYEAARALAASHGELLVNVQPMLSLELKVFGVPLAAAAASIRVKPLDLVLGAVYAVHPVYFLALLVYALRRSLRLYYALLTALAASSLVAVLFYAAYPTAPPWIAVPGLVREPNPLVELVSRIRGGGVDPNPYAAFPSMHVALAVVAARALWREGVGGGWLLLWPVVMSASTIYTGNHYLADVLAGWLLGWAAEAVGARAAPRLAGRCA